MTPGKTREKRFDYTSTNGFTRLTKVTTPMGNLIRYDYTFRGGLAWRRDGNGRVTRYQYDPLERLVSVTDDNNNVLLSLDYDALGNVTRVASTNSVLEYTYDPLNRVTNAVCLLTNVPGFATVKYKIDYGFDPVGNVTNRVITGLAGFTDWLETRYAYDCMNRLTNIAQLGNGNPLASAWYAYDAAGRLWRKGYGNGDVVTHAYDTESRLLSLGITNGATMVALYNYQWDAGGNILAITNNGTNVTLYGYDRVGQLTNEICFTNGLAGGATNSWTYDEAGNWLNPLQAGTKWVYNKDNELTARADTSDTTWSAAVTGQVDPGPRSNKWYNTWAECRGVWGRVGTNDGTFSLPNVALNPGENPLVVTVTDVSGNQSTETRTVTKVVTNCQEYFVYDGNGNLTNWVNGSTNWVYEWDWADRLTNVSSNGVVVLENWYDANGRRIAKSEVVNGQTQQWMYVCDDRDIAAVLNQAAHPQEAFTRGVGLAGDIGTVVAVTRVAGGLNTYYTHCNHRGDVVLARSGTSTAGRYEYGAFGNLNSVAGSDVCRFKFSSKERDAATRFSYYGYRFYAPQWQRWLSSDPEEEEGGINLYAFTLNDPIQKVDTDGGGPSDTKDKPKKGKPSKPGKRPSKCDKCEWFAARLKNPNNPWWDSDCQDFCLHVCQKPWVPNQEGCVRTCQGDCDAGKIPSPRCVFTPPRTPPGRPTK